MNNNNGNMFLYADLPLSFQRKFTITGICSIVFGILSIGFEYGGLANTSRFVGGGHFSGAFSIYVGILLLILCRQQIYVLKSLLALIIIQLLLVLHTVIFGCLILATSRNFQCQLKDFLTEEESVKKCEKSRILSILAIITSFILLVSIIFNLVLAIRTWRARRQTVDDIGSSSSNDNSYLLTNIPLLLRKKLCKTGIAYIVLGLSIIGLDVGLLLNGYPFSCFTGFFSGFFSVVYGIVLIILSGKRIYVLTSLFCLALWQLFVLLVTFIMILLAFNVFCGFTQESPYDKEFKRAYVIALVSLIAVSFSLIMTVLNMAFIVKGRQREQQHEELLYHPLD